MRPIDADAMIERYNVKNTDIAECLTNPETAREFEKFCIIADALEKEPTLNLVRVVRCKDCVEYRDTVGACHYFNYESTDEMDFCSHGVRREEEKPRETVTPENETV